MFYKMPCVTGRSNHVLLRKDCKAGCGCCVNTAYSCAPPCFKEERINQSKPDVSDLVCALIKRGVVISCEDGLDFANNLDSTGDLPAKHCLFRVEQRNASSSVAGVIIAEVEDLNIVIIEDNFSSTPGDVVEYYVNGVLCTSCTIPIV